MKNRISEPTITFGQMNLLFQVRNLWRQLVTWTRAYLTNKHAGRRKLLMHILQAIRISSMKMYGSFIRMPT